MTLTQAQIAAIMPQQNGQRIADIIASASRETGVSVNDICGYSRKRRVVRARHIAMWMLRQDGITFDAIGSAIGGRDHTTVIHGVNRIEEILKATQQKAPDH